VEVYVARNRDMFDTIYLDPPFDYRFKANLVERIAERRILDQDGRLVIHYPAGDDLPDRTGDLACTDERSYGRSTVRIYTIAGDATP
jgi:16S rRNA G966 N2-methylase RsmD